MKTKIIVNFRIILSQQYFILIDIEMKSILWHAKSIRKFFYKILFSSVKSLQ